MKKYPLRHMLERAGDLRETCGRGATLLGIGPMSEYVIKASLELGKEKGFPLMFIASRNQIDSAGLGGGYVRGWDQTGFVRGIGAIASETGFDGLYYICRDHGGPWQRDNERNSKLPEEEAMELCRRSYLADLLAGFDLLHIDPTKDPHTAGQIPMEAVIRRTVELIRYVETERIQRGLPPVDYEVGTEETSGGLTSEGAYEAFIEELNRRLAAEGLPAPCFIVGQTGTLVRMTENVGRFDADTARRLSGAARKHGMGLKEHNADYLSDGALLMHPAIGIAAANVAPEFGVAETGSYLLLAGVEREAKRLGIIKEASGFAACIREATVRNQRWRKWMVGDAGCLPLEAVLKDEALADIITRSSGHYTFEDEEVKRQLEILFANLRTCGIDPERVVIDRIKRSIGRYADCFGLAGLTSELQGPINSA